MTKSLKARTESIETSLVAVAKLILTVLALIAVVGMTVAHTTSVLKASIAHAYDPCDPVAGQSIDPTPQDVAGCTKYWNDKKGIKDVTFEAPRSFPCNPKYGGACPSTYIYHTDAKKAKLIWEHVFNYLGIGRN